MTQDVYQSLAKFLDQLPSGFPASQTGVELRILRQLFTPEEAQMAQALRMKPEPAQAIAQRVGQPLEQVAPLLHEMARKGLIFSIETPERPPAYMASQFVIGIWEYQVNNLTPQFVKDVEEYMPLLSRVAFEGLPQLRTIPIGKSLAASAEVLPYESASELIKGQQKILVAPCICRREHKMKGGGCGKLEEACLVFGWGADYYQRNGLGRMISQDEAMGILQKAEQEGLVLQPSNSQEIVNICLCCGDCCQVLVNLKRHPQPSQVTTSPFIASLDESACIACGVCTERCQMEALTMGEDHVELNQERCIGCGLCVTTCPSEALSLERKPEQPQVPKGPAEAIALRARLRAELQAKLERHQNL